MKDKLIVNTNTLVSIVDYNRISYFKSDDCYTLVQLIDDTHLVICKTLAKVEVETPAARFLRVHGSYLINKEHIKSIDKTNKIVNMANGAKIPYTIKIKDFLSSI